MGGFITRTLAKQERIKFRILVPLILAIGILLTAFGLGIDLQERQSRERSLQRTAQAVERLISDSQQRYCNTMELTIQTLLNDDTLAEALQTGNRAVLLERTRPLYQNLEHLHHVTHFYFHSPERINVLRVHNPELYGDRIDGVVQASERSGRMASGLQQGRFGAYVLRVVSPWVRKGRLIGYVELGVDLKDILAGIHNGLDVQVFVAVNKVVLDRKQWEEASRQRDWDQYPYVVMMDKTTNVIPAEVEKYLLRSPKELVGVAEVVRARNAVNEMFVQPLLDASGRASAQLIVLRDVTPAIAQTRKLLETVAFICLPVSAILIGLFHVFLGRIEGQLAERTAKLESEIAERQAAQKGLREANESLEERVALRTQELSSANADLRREIAQREATQKELVEAQKQLLEASHQAGMAEVATSVLHNVGNVLNSVNVSTALVRNRIRDSKTAYLGKAVGLMRAHKEDLGAFLLQDSRGKRLPGYLESLAVHLDEERVQVLQELGSLEHNIEHINEIVQMQQSYATVSSLLEPLRISEVVEEALRLNAVALERRHIQVVREFSPVTPIPLDKHKTLQILVNLLTNACHACAETQRPDRRVIIQVTAGPTWTRVKIIDNGIGITPENLARVFTFGFTTRKNGHGFGLHSAALAAKQLGGSLKLVSDGPGLGATAVLELVHTESTIRAR